MWEGGGDDASILCNEHTKKDLNKTCSGFHADREIKSMLYWRERERGWGRVVNV